MSGLKRGARGVGGLCPDGGSSSANPSTVLVAGAGGQRGIGGGAAAAGGCPPPGGGGAGGAAAAAETGAAHGAGPTAGWGVAVITRPAARDGGWLSFRCRLAPAS